MPRTALVLAGLLLVSACVEDPTTPLESFESGTPSFAASAAGIQAVDLGGSPSRAFGINESGFIVGSTNGNGIAAVWTGPGALSVVGPGLFSQFHDVNEEGVAVGYWAVEGGTIHAVRWTAAGGFQDIGTLRQGSYTYAHAINNAGQIVGNDQQGGQRPYLWSPSSGMTALTVLPGSINGIAFDINDAGTVVGESHAEFDGINHAILWTPSNAVVDLGSLGGRVSSAYGINSSGEVVGWSMVENGEHHAFIWTASGGMVDINTWGTPCPGASEAEAINDDGKVVGACDGRPVIWTRSAGMQELGTPSVATQGRAYDIDSQGRVVGTFGNIGAAMWIVDPMAEAAIALSGLAHIYDGTPKAATATTSPAELTGITITYTQNGSPVASPTDVGTYEVTASLSNPQYEAPDAQGTLEIGPATPDLVWNTPAPIVLGTALTDAQLNAIPRGVDNATLPGELTYSPAAGTVLGAGPSHLLQVQFIPTDLNYSPATAEVRLSVIYSFSGFFQPVDNPPVVNKTNSGLAIPVKFNLGGDQGLNIFSAGSPSSGLYSCTSTAEDLIEVTIAASTSSLSYDAITGLYQYVWKTEKSWANSCRKLVIQLKDGTVHQALFHFVK
jgi:probable HAF family extracellular repeat protein